MTGKADRDFVAMMIAHHQGAIDMEKAELHCGRDPAIRKLAPYIVAHAGEAHHARAALAGEARALSRSAPWQHAFRPAASPPHFSRPAPPGSAPICAPSCRSPGRAPPDR